jgi:hypothetical protein
VQRHQPRRAVRRRPAQPLAGLASDALDPLGGLLERGDGRASAAARSAIPARSALIAATSALAASVRRRRFAAMSRARDRTDRVRSTVFVRDASPASLIRRTVVTSFATPLASNPESVG